MREIVIGYSGNRTTFSVTDYRESVSMTRMTAKDFDQELLDLYDYYAHGKITKRQFLDRAGKFAVGGVTAMALLEMLSPNYALAQQISFNDPDIVPEYITYPSPGGTGDVRDRDAVAAAKALVESIAFEHDVAADDMQVAAATIGEHVVTLEPRMVRSAWRTDLWETHEDLIPWCELVRPVRA